MHLKLHQRDGNTTTFDYQMCEVPWAVITNCHKLCGLKQQNLIFSQLQRPEVPESKRWILFSLETLGKNLSSPPPASVGSRPFLVCGCITPSAASTFTWLSSLCLCFLLSSLLQGHLSLDLGSTWIVQDNLISRSLITSEKTLLSK